MQQYQRCFGRVSLGFVEILQKALIVSAFKDYNGDHGNSAGEKYKIARKTRFCGLNYVETVKFHLLSMLNFH